MQEMLFDTRKETVHGLVMGFMLKPSSDGGLGLTKTLAVTAVRCLKGKNDWSPWMLGALIYSARKGVDNPVAYARVVSRGTYQEKFFLEAVELLKDFRTRTGEL